MEKKVIFTGCNTKLYPEAEVLEVGRVYEVMDKQEKRLQTLLFLKGIKGSFDKEWFEPYYEISFAYSHIIPKEGTYLYDFIRLNKRTKKFERISKSNSPIKNVIKTSYNTYTAYTKEELYMIEVIPK